MSDSKEDISIEEISGVGEKTARELQQAGYFDVVSLARTSADILADVTSMSENKAEGIVAKAREHIKEDNFNTGAEVREKHKSIKKISTGSKAFDDLLRGGVPTNYITEAHGKFGSGKSQIAHQLAVNVYKDLGRGCIYLDTEDTFMPERIEDMAEAAGLDTDEVLDNILVAKSHDSGHQYELGKQLHQKCSERDIGLIIVDSIIAQFRADYSGRQELGARQDKLNKHLKDLKRMASTFDAAVYITNQVMEDPGEMFGNPVKPVGGNVLAHAATFRIYLRSKSKCHVARLIDSPNLPPGEVEFDITEAGIVDAE